MRLLWLALFIVTGCGHQTDPKPTGDLTTQMHLPALKVTHFFQGPLLQIQWSTKDEPKHEAVQWVRLHFIYPKESCNLCTQSLSGWVKIRSDSTSDIESTLPGFKKSQIQQWRSKQGVSGILLEPSLLHLKQPLFLQVDYLTTNEQLGSLSQPQSIDQPSSIALPQILGVRWTAIKQETDVLSLSWRPVTERSYQELTPNGGNISLHSVYGLMLYDSEMSTEQPINKAPLLTGTVQIIHPKQPLWARHQDRFGNLSDGVQIGVQGP